MLVMATFELEKSVEDLEKEISEFKSAFVLDDAYPLLQKGGYGDIEIFNYSIVLASKYKGRHNVVWINSTTDLAWRFWVKSSERNAVKPKGLYTDATLLTDMRELRDMPFFDENAIETDSVYGTSDTASTGVRLDSKGLLEIRSMVTRDIPDSFVERYIESGEFVISYRIEALKDMPVLSFTVGALGGAIFRILSLPIHKVNGEDYASVNHTVPILFKCRLIRLMYSQSLQFNKFLSWEGMTLYDIDPTYKP